MNKDLEYLIDVAGNLTDETTTVIKEKARKIVEKLEKEMERNIPKTPRFLEFCAFNNRKEYECPNCSASLPLYESFECHYCPECGQAINLENIKLWRVKKK